MRSANDAPDTKIIEINSFQKQQQSENSDSLHQSKNYSDFNHLYAAPPPLPEYLRDPLSREPFRDPVLLVQVNTFFFFVSFDKGINKGSRTKFSADMYKYIDLVDLDNKQCNYLSWLLHPRSCDIPLAF